MKMTTRWKHTVVAMLKKHGPHPLWLGSRIPVQGEVEASSLYRVPSFCLLSTRHLTIAALLPMTGVP